MAIVRRYMATADNRPEHDIGQMDADVGGTMAIFPHVLGIYSAVVGYLMVWLLC